MSTNPIKKVICSIALLFFLAGITSACHTRYMQNRRHDWGDTFDLGLVYNTKLRPNFELYLDWFSTFPFGFSYVDDTKMWGMTHRQYGTFDKNSHAWGLLLWGKEKRGVGKFNPNNPYHARPEWKDVTDFPRVDHGMIGVWAGKEKIPKYQYGQCSRGIHLGWVGLEFSCRLPELIDFLLGWTTYDLMGDDQ